MAVRTNTLNGGTTYVDMDIQVVSADASQYTLRAVIYLTSLNVSDTSNSCSVTGQWGRSGTLNVGGVYNSTAVWFQDVSFARTGVDQLIGWNLSWSGVNYWGGTLSGTAYYTIPAALQPPGAPFGYSARNITASSAYTTGVSSSGTGHNNLWVQCNLPSGPIVSERQMGSWTDGYMDGLSPGTVYHFRVAAANAAGWSAWGGYVAFTTAAIVPSAPAAPVVTPTSGSTATATMVLPAANGATIDQTVYRVYNSVGTIVIDYFAPSALTSYGLTGLTPGASYTLGVFAHNSVGYSVESTRTSFTMPTTTPGAPTAVMVDLVDDDSMRVSWTPPASNGGSAIITYGVFVATDAGFLTTIYSANHSASPVVIDGLDPGTPYWVIVYAYNVNGYGAPSSIVPFVTTGVPGEAALSLNVGGVWKPTEMWLNVAGTWKLCQLWMNTHGTWRRIS